MIIALFKEPRLYRLLHYRFIGQVHSHKCQAGDITELFAEALYHFGGVIISGLLCLPDFIFIIRRTTALQSQHHRRGRYRSTGGLLLPGDASLESGPCPENVLVPQSVSLPHDLQDGRPSRGMTHTLHYFLFGFIKRHF